MSSAAFEDVVSPRALRSVRQDEVCLSSHSILERFDRKSNRHFSRSSRQTPPSIANDMVLIDLVYSVGFEYDLRVSANLGEQGVVQTVLRAGRYRA